MPFINKFQLDGELRSQLNFEFIPIYEGGILSGATPAVPFEDGSRLRAGVDSSVYVKFKATPLMVQTANVWIYFSYITGTSTDDFDFDIYYQIFPIGDPVGPLVGPISTSITPDGTTNLQTSIEVINNSVTAWRVPSPLKKNSFVRFEIVRKGTTDTNIDDLKILDISYATIPSYQTLADFDDGLNQPLIPVPTGTNILNDRGQLLSHDGGGDIAIPYPGDGKILVTDDTDPVGVTWADSSTLGSVKPFFPTIITTDTILTQASHGSFTILVNNPSVVSSITLTLPPAADFINGGCIDFYNLTVNPNGFKVLIVPDGTDVLNDRGGPTSQISLGNEDGESLHLKTDSNNWYNLNMFPEVLEAPFAICQETPVFPGDSITFNISGTAQPPFYMFVNNIIYSSPTHFTVSGVSNNTWTWLNALFPLIASDEIRLIYNCGGLGSGLQNIEQFTATPAQTIFTLSQDAQPPFFFYINGNAYTTPTSFTVGGVGNRTWTWLNIDFVLSGGEEILLQFFVP